LYRFGGPFRRHAVGFWDAVIDGEMWHHGEGQFEKRVHRPGDRIYVGPNQGRGMNFTTGVWSVEYARGPLPFSVPFGLADGPVNTLDFASVAPTPGIYAALVWRLWQQPGANGAAPSELRQTIGSALSRVGQKATRRLRPPEPDDEIPSGAAG
jgi:hypothetical protein